MTDYAAQLLNELMGKNRDLLPDQHVQKLTYDSPEVCHYYLVKLCPHDLFTNTRVDMGSCGGVHDDDARDEFLKLPPHRKLAYEDEFLRYCQSLINDVERKIRKSRQRLELQPDDEKLASLVPPQFSRQEERIASLNTRISKLVTEVEELGCKGQVDEAQAIMRLCDKLKDERERLKRNNESSVWHQAAEMAASQEKQMQVCDICGSFLILSDAQQRIDDHLTGKQHLGYARLRQVVDEMRAGREKQKMDQEAAREKEREERRQRDAERAGRSGSRPDRDRDRDRDRERERGLRNGDRERNGERRRHRSRSRDRDRDRDRRDRDSDHRRDRDRDHRRDRDRDRRDRRDRDRDSDRRDRDSERSHRDSDRRDRDSERRDRDSEKRDRDHEKRERDHDSERRDRDRDRDRDEERRDRDRDRDEERRDRDRDEERRDRDRDRHSRRSEKRSRSRSRSGSRSRRRSKERRDSRERHEESAPSERTGPRTPAGPRTPSAEPPDAGTPT